MKTDFKTIIFITIVFLSSSYGHSFSGIPDIESTRTKSTGSAGVGAILLNEAPLLNPASIAFLGKSSFYFQNVSAELTDENDQRLSSFSDSLERIVVITDTSSAMNGGVSYQYQNGEYGKRIRYSVSASQAIGPKAALGVIYRYTQEESELYDENYHQFVIGGTYIPTKSTIIGFTVVDPSQDQSEYFKYTAGVHYTLNDFVSLLADIGSGDVKNYDQESITNLAIQIQSFKSWYLRYGRFHDKHQNLKGTGVGLSWVGPRFSIDYSYKISENISENSGTIFKDEKIEETSFALAMLF